MYAADNFHEIFTRIRGLTPIRTQRHLAEILHVQQVTISRNKKANNFPLKWIDKINDVFGFTNSQYLLTGKGVKPESTGGIKETFEERFREAREKYGSKEKLAQALSVDVNIFIRWELNFTKNIDPELLNKVANILDVSARELLYGSDLDPSLIRVPLAKGSEIRIPAGKLNNVRVCVLPEKLRSHMQIIVGQEKPPWGNREIQDIDEELETLQQELKTLKQKLENRQQKVVELKAIREEQTMYSNKRH